MDLDYSLMMGLDYNLMMDLTDVELKLEELEAGYKKKYFRKDTKRAWSFNCHCGEKVGSNIAEEYFIALITRKDPNAIGRFCSKECAEIYFNEQRNELLVERERIIEERRKMREVYEEAERKFIAIKEKS